MKQFYLENKIEISDFNLFKRFLKYGGIPQLQFLEDENYELYLNNLYDSIIIKDIVQRNKITNIKILQNLLLFMIDNSAKITTPCSIHKQFICEFKEINISVVYNLLDCITNSCLFKTVSRYDVKGKAILNTYEKYYLSDLGFRNLINCKDEQLGRKLENVIYNGLIFHGCDVYIGKNLDKEIDFYVKTSKNEYYIQVTWSLSNEDIINREFGAFKNLTDGITRYVISTDFDMSNFNIKQINAIEFLLNFSEYIK